MWSVEHEPRELRNSETKLRNLPSEVRYRPKLRHSETETPKLTETNTQEGQAPEMASRQSPAPVSYEWVLFLAPFSSAHFDSFLGSKETRIIAG